MLDSSCFRGYYLLVSNLDDSNQTASRSLVDKIMELRRCCERMQSEVDRSARVSEAQCAVLRAMPSKGSLHTGEICRRAGLSASRGGRVIEELVKAGWAERVTDPSDRRISRIRLTPAGQDRRNQVDTLLDACDVTMRDQLAPEQLRDVEASVDLLLKIMGGP